jgi:hypothetical protein
MLDNVKGSIAKGFVSKLANDNDTKTTVLGAALSGLLIANIDFGKLFANDPNEIGKAAGALVIGLLGYYTNKPKTKAG